MLEVALLQQVPTQVPLMAALHHDDHGARLGIVHARRHRYVPPVERRFTSGIRFNFINFVWIVAHNSITAFAGDRPAD